MWSRNDDKCLNCGTISIKHLAKGLCKKCYSLNNERKQNKIGRHKRGVAVKLLTKEKLIELYVKKKLSLGDIGKLVGTSRTNVHTKLKQFHIPVRDRVESRAIALDNGKIQYYFTNENGATEKKTLRKVRFNKTFFTRWSKEMAYVLGVIYTDGTLRLDIRQNSQMGSLSIFQKEKELLEKVLTLMECEVNIVTKTRREYNNVVRGEGYRFGIVNNLLYKQLIDLGVTPNKSLILKFPNIPKEYARHFIRGCWDGDGTVYIEKRNGHLKSSFICGSLNFIKMLLQYLEDAGLSKRKLYTDTRSKGGNTSYYFRYATKDSIKLFHYLYRDVTESQYLKRKYSIFFNYLNNSKILNSNYPVN